MRCGLASRGATCGALYGHTRRAAIAKLGGTPIGGMPCSYTAVDPDEWRATQILARCRLDDATGPGALA